MNKCGLSFELLNYVWLEGFVSYYFDINDKPLRFPSLNEALAELQDDFDIVAQEIADGGREPDCGLSPEEFQIRCVETDARFAIEWMNGRVCIAGHKLGVG